jgi:hypothetical protein
MGSHLQWRINRGRNPPDEPTLLFSFLLAPVSFVSCFLASLFPSQTPATVHRHGIQAPILALQLRGFPRSSKEADGVADTGLRVQGAARDRVAGQHVAWRLCFLLGIRPRWVSAASVFFLPHAARAL